MVLDGTRHHSLMETVSASYFRAAATKSDARRTTADTAKHLQGWDSRTKVAHDSTTSVSVQLQDSTSVCSLPYSLLHTGQDLKGGRTKASCAISRASSDAGSVLDSTSSTPRGRGPTRLQQQHTLQAVASRLQYVQSSEAPYPHRALGSPRITGSSTRDAYSDTASWAGDRVRDLLQADCACPMPFTKSSTLHCSLTGDSSRLQTWLNIRLRTSKA